MAKQLRWVIAIVSLVLIVGVPLFQRTMSTGGFKSFIIMTRKGIRGQKMVAVKQHRERTDEAVVTYPRSDQSLREIDPCGSYQLRKMGQVELDAIDSKNRGSRILFTQRKVEPKFQYKKQIPGGPDPQHHRQRKGI